jgi:hypothetical protein
MPSLIHVKEDLMRRLLAATALSAVVFVGAGCAGTPDTTGDASSPSPSSSPSSTVDVAGNTKQVCAEVRQVNSDSVGKITKAITEAVQAGAKGDETAGQKAVDQANAITGEWVSKLQAEGAKAANPELAKALKDIATEVQKLRSEDATLNQMNATVKNAETVLNKYCS